VTLTVVGATGQIGSEVVALLSAIRHEVVDAARSTGADSCDPPVRRIRSGPEQDGPQANDH
jgi:uncharacterized protein YbjT (DUF2867 family)